MYAIVEIAGLQYKVEKDRQLYVNRLQGEAGDTLTFDKVLLTDNGSVTVGAPVIEGLSVEAKIVEHVKADKVIVFKKKRRKGYKKKNGHRQQMTKIEILSIGGATASKSASKPKKAKAKAETKGDKLTTIEGVGPKVEELFNEKGIYSFADMASKTVEELKAILEEKGGVYAGMNPDTWVKQAELAAAGKMDELKKWQDELNAGK